MKTVIKDFIFESPEQIAGLAPIRERVNEFGVTIYYYLINNANKSCIEAIAKRDNLTTDEHIKWFFNRWAIAIVNKGYLLNKFLAKDNFQLRGLWTNTDVFIIPRG